VPVEVPTEAPTAEATEPPAAEPTDTPIPPTPTAIPPTPTLAGPPPLEAVNTSSFEAYDWFHIVGEIINEAGYDAEFVEIVATIYDEGGNFVNSDFAFIALDIVPAGGKACFDLGTEANPLYHRYELQVQGYPAEVEPQPTIQLLSHAPSTEYGWFHVKGEVQNTGDRSAEFVEIIGTFYDAAGIVIACDFTFTELDVLAPGQKSPFDMGLELPGDLDHYDLAIQAHFAD